MEADLVEMRGVLHRALSTMEGVNVEDFGSPQATVVDDDNTEDNDLHQRLVTQREIDGRQISTPPVQPSLDLSLLSESLRLP